MPSQAQALLFGVLLCCLRPGPAQAEPPLQGPTRTVVRVASPQDEELLLRTAGQTVDLEVALVPQRGPLEPTPAEQLEAARTLGQALKARFVVWFVPAGAGALLIEVAEPGAAGLLSRRVVAQGTGRVARSATAEAAGLVVRSALRAFLEQPPPALAVPEAPMVIARTPGAAQGAPWHLGVGLGWQAGFDGASPQGQHQLALDLGAERGPLYLGLGLAYGPGAQLTDTLTTVDLGRSDIALRGAYLRSLTGRWQVLVGAAVGVLVYSRSTAVLPGTGGGVQATPSSVLPALLLAPEVRLRFFPLVRQRLSLAIELAAAADGVVGAPNLVYTVAGMFQVRDRLWPVQPLVGLRLVLLFHHRAKR